MVMADDEDARDALVGGAQDRFERCLRRRIQRFGVVARMPVVVQLRTAETATFPGRRGTERARGFRFRTSKEGAPPP
jgi:hypothetical protein